jgi:hypothetical protein
MTKLNEVQVGDKLKADGGFECINPDTILEVKSSHNGLYVDCACGKHNLDGQVDWTDHVTLVGLVKV